MKKRGTRGEIAEEKTKTISGKDLGKLLGVKPRDYNALYPNRKSISNNPSYCPCLDLGIGGDCHGMITVMNALTRNKINEFPEDTEKISEGEYKSGEVWIDKSYDIAYFYIGKTSVGRDVALNLGGDTYNKGNIEIGYVNKGNRARLNFDRKIFPKE
jgi:hypothetical protein